MGGDLLTVLIPFPPLTVLHRHLDTFWLLFFLCLRILCSYIECSFLVLLCDYFFCIFEQSHHLCLLNYEFIPVLGLWLLIVMDAFYHHMHVFVYSFLVFECFVIVLFCFLGIGWELIFENVDFLLFPPTRRIKFISFILKKHYHFYLNLHLKHQYF